MDCKVCGAKDISPSMGGDDICGACDCGGICVIGGKKYLNLDYISAYQHLLAKSLEPKVEEIYKVVKPYIGNIDDRQKVADAIVNYLKGKK